MTKYYYLDQNKRQYGPFALDALRSQAITPETLVWCEGLTNWVSAKSVNELSFLFAQAVQYPPQPRSQMQYAPNRFNNETHCPPKTWMLESIFITVLCCVPLGVVAIVYAAQVENLFYSGNYERANESSKKAGLFVKLGFGISIAGMVLYILFWVVMILIGTVAGH